MRVLVTGSSGHLGEALVRVLRDAGDDVVGLDVLPSAWTDVVASVTDRSAVRAALAGAGAVLHTATLHKPHVGTHPRQAFVDTNVTGTLTVLEEAATAGVGRVVVTSTTSAFGRALVPAPGEPAAWVTEAVPPRVRNVYGPPRSPPRTCASSSPATPACRWWSCAPPASFPEGDDADDVRAGYDDDNVKVNELLNRRVDLADVVSAHRAAVDRAPGLGFGRYVVSATTPFRPEHLAELRTDAPAVVARLFPDAADLYDRLGWRLFPGIDRVYVNDAARADLGWTPAYDFRAALDLLARGRPPRSDLALTVGAKGYHAESTGPYTRR
ncbi:NAD-dependent epimerase/dehydratase family protein [Geodermatophilus sp. URMC 62]|uniref:NAD-dependent epimerase/dehydratase family protein n=1 Tax=Geodermatophilus sp. URMC 62 TaxID=3423414 RepID=UPI00406CFEF0